MIDYERALAGSAEPLIGFAVWLGISRGHGFLYLESFGEKLGLFLSPWMPRWYILLENIDRSVEQFFVVVLCGCFPVCDEESTEFNEEVVVLCGCFTLAARLRGRTRDSVVVLCGCFFGSSWAFSPVPPKL